MCYPKPGPRCSASAAARYTRAKHAQFAYFQKHRGEVDYNVYEQLVTNRNVAEHEYSITPAGIKALERGAEGEPTDSFAQQKLAVARQERAARIKAAKVPDTGDHHHQKRVTAETTPAYTKQNLSPEGARLEEIDQYGPEVATLMATSEAWVQHLTADEIEVLHWYSMAGYEAVNGSLSDPNFEAHAKTRGLGKQAASPNTISLLDSAIAKVTPQQPAIVYRRHFFYTPDGGFAHLTQEEMQTQFQPGNIYRPGFYMSTSLNPRNVSMGAGGFMVCLEIKTHRGAPLAAVAQQGTAETEILLPRDGAYRVISNNRQVTINSHGKSKDIWVIQLEELPAA